VQLSWRCSRAAAGGRVWGNAEKAIETLKKKAVAVGADVVVEVHCGAAPLVRRSCRVKIHHPRRQIQSLS